MATTDLLIKAAIPIISAILKRHLEASGQDASCDPEQQLGTHLRLTYKWAHELQTYGMAAPIDTVSQTIELTIHSEPRKFRDSLTVQSAPTPEDDIIVTPHNYIILGDPGSGKTTTIRRLITKMFLPAMPDSVYQYPILVRLRESKYPDNLFREICDIISAPVKYIKDLPPDEHRSYMVGNKSISRFIIDFLNETRAIVFVDGLDELSSQYKLNVERQLSEMALSMGQAKLIVSCRSGDYTRSVDGFRIIEIAGLDPDGIKAICTRWLGIETDRFIKAAAVHPMFQLADRPLFLMQLLLLFKAHKDIPENVAEVYRQVILIAIQRWDIQRGVYRRSKYSGFTPDRKVDFIANFAYELFYELREATLNFGHEELEKIYQKIYSAYGLPISEAVDVVSEIESHTGIIVESRSGRFEFSHLILQEYLAAYHIVRNPFPRSLQWYLKGNAAPLAVAVSIASNSSAYFASLILTGSRGRYFSREQLVAFLRRLIVERPFFGVDVLLGMAILRLVFEYEADETVMSLVRSILALNNVGKAAVDAMGQYNRGRANREGRINFEKIGDYPNEYGLETPEYGVIGVDMYNTIMEYQ